MVRIAFEARLGSVILLYMLILCDRIISFGFFLLFLFFYSIFCLSVACVL